MIDDRRQAGDDPRRKRAALVVEVAAVPFRAGCREPQDFGHWNGVRDEMSDRVERHRLGQQRHLRFATLPAHHTDDRAGGLVGLRTWTTQPGSAFLTHINPTRFGYVRYTGRAGDRVWRSQRISVTWRLQIARFAVRRM